MGWLLGDSQGVEGGHKWFRGNAGYVQGDLRVQADALDIFQRQSPKGEAYQELVAVGNVVIMRQDERLAGTKLTMNLDTGWGVLDDVVGYVNPEVFVRARRVERLDPRTLKVKDGTFTSCCQPNPRWSFWAPKATIKVGKRINALSPTFLAGTPPLVNKVVKQAPLFWLPWFYYPIQENGRATGFLIPSFNIAPGRGVDLEPAFFWAMGRSMDQTFSYEFRPGLTPRIGHEFRYVRSERNRGTFVSYFFPPQKAGTTVAEGLPAPSTKWEYDLDWSAQEMLPLGFRSQLKVKLVSEQNQIQDSFFRTAGRNRRDGSLVLTRDTALGALQIEARSSFVARNRRDELFTKLPSVSLTALPKRLGHTGLLWKYELHGDRFVKDEDYFLRGENGEKTHEAYNRYDAMTEISRPYAVSYLTVTPSLSTRYTLYSASLATVGPDQLAVGDPLDRRYVRGEVRLAGPNLSRVFANPFRGYTDRFKHVIGPEVIWSFNSHVGRADAVPQLGAFDTIDNIFATNQIQYGLAQTLWARRPGPSRKLAPYQVLSWRVYQTYYFNLKDAHLRYDPSYGTRALGPGDVPARRSPIRSELRLTLSRNVMANWTVQYDVNFKQLSQSSLNASLHNARGSLDAYWSRFELLTDKIEDRESFDNYTARGWVDVLPKRLKLTGEGAYNGSQKLLQYYGLGGQVNVQCFGLMLNLRKTSIGNGEYRSQFGFAIQLGGLGSIGMDPTAGGSTFRGMR